MDVLHASSDVNLVYYLNSIHKYTFYLATQQNKAIQLQLVKDHNNVFSKLTCITTIHLFIYIIFNVFSF